MLSLSASPAFGPWGIPFELDELELVVDPPPLELLDPPPPDELELWVWLAGLVEEPELDELEPQAARPRAASTRRLAARRLADLVIVMLITRSLGVGPDYFRTLT